jgi:hypothetical protein
MNRITFTEPIALSTRRVALALLALSAASFGIRLR